MTVDLAEKAGIASGLAGVDLCCVNAADMPFLTRFQNLARMRGIGASEASVGCGCNRCEAEGLSASTSHGAP